MLLARCLAAALAVAMTAPALAADGPFFPPESPARPVVETAFGVTLTDRYRWLENGKDPSVAAWTRAQHAATVAYLDRNAPPVPGLTDELSRYFDRDKTDAPFFKNGREFFQRTRKGEPQAKLFTRLDGKDVLLLDPIALDPTGKTKVGSVVPNRDASKLAVGIYAKGSEIQDFRIIDSRTGAAIGEPITGLNWFGWARDERYALPVAAHGGIGREAGAAQVLPPSSRQRSQGRRAADHDEGRQGILPGLRARGGRLHGVRDRRLLVEHDPHPPAWLDRGAADDLLQRQAPGGCDVPEGSHLHPHQRRRTELEADGGELRQAGVRRLADADPGAEDRAGRRRR